MGGNDIINAGARGQCSSRRRVSNKRRGRLLEVLRYQSHSRAAVKFEVTVSAMRARYSMFFRHVEELAGVVETVNYNDVAQNIVLLSLIPQLYCGVNHCLSL